MLWPNIVQELFFQDFANKFDLGVVQNLYLV